MPASQSTLSSVERWLNDSRHRLIMFGATIAFWVLAAVNFFIPYGTQRWRLGVGVLVGIPAIIGTAVLGLILRNAFRDRQKRSRDELLELIKESIKSVLPREFITAIHLAEPAQWALAYEINSRRYGWGYEKVSVTVTINPDGSAELRREITVRAFRTLSGLEQSLALDPAKPETLTDQSSEPRFFVKGIGCEARLNERRLSDGVWVTEVNFEPTLAENSAGSFVLTETLPRDHYAIGHKAQELIDAGDQDQYYAFRIDRPTRELGLVVYLPAGYRADNCKAQVRLIPPARAMESIRTDPYEEKRIENSLQVPAPEGRRYKLTLNVNWPVLGRVYVVRWDPLSPSKALNG